MSAIHPAADTAWIAWSSHERGEPGAIRSVERTAARATTGRLNPRVRAWAIRKIREAGSPTDNYGRAKAIYEALVREKIYVGDPVDAELIVGAACLLDRCGDLSLEGGDCDDLVVGLVAAWESVGLRSAVIGHQYAQVTFEHVLGAVHDGTRWWYGDPAKKLPFGTASMPTRERWIAVPSGRVLCDERGPCDLAAVSPFVEAGREKGDFLGVGSGGDMATLEQLSGADLQSAQRDFATWSQALAMGRAAMVREYALMANYRKATDRPLVDVYIQASGPSWTADMEKRLRTLADASAQALSYGLQGASGQRRIDRDPETGRTGVVGYSYEPALYVEQDGALVFVKGQSGGAEVIPAGFTAGGPLVGVLVVCATIVVLASAYVLTTTMRDHIARQREKDKLEHQSALLARGLSADQVDKLQKSLTEQVERETNAEAGKQKEDPWAKVAEVAKFGAIALTATAIAGALASLIGAFRPPRYAV